MKQLQFEFDNEENFRREVRKSAQWYKTSMCSAAVFDIYTDNVDLEKIDLVCSIIREEIPDAIYRGCTTNGNIFQGRLSKADTCIICTIFEYPSTNVRVLQYPLTAETAEDVAEQLRSEISELPWVKAVEMLVTIRGMSMTGFCERLSTFDEKIKIFGGGAFGPDFNDNVAYVFSSAGKCSDKSVVFLLLGGDDFNILTTHITGWKPLGKELLVTKAKGSILYELDGKPAYETYYKYLNIKNDENFFTNTLEFPFFYEHNGINILRAPTASNPDGSLVMTSDVDENVKARIAYGDPWTILNSVREGGLKIHAFQPQVIHLYSCAARRTFWGEEIDKESQPSQSMAPTSGFYTSGEFLRTNGSVNQHNVTLVLAAMREGEPTSSYNTDFEMTQESFSGKVSMINRLATFIEAATEELEEANRKLADMAVKDGLTQLYNRMEIQRQINNSLKKYGESTALIMIDADNFKNVNDTYGHSEGDTVLKGLSAMLKRVIDSTGVEAQAGRWGGEEFMVCLSGESSARAAEIAEIFRHEFEIIEFPSAGHQTISLGTAKAHDGETSDNLCKRVDDALYKAKKSGKNIVLSL